MHKFTRGAEVIRTAYRGEIDTTYGELVEVFGPPDYGPDHYDLDSVTCEWRLRFEDGTVASIYDYKSGLVYTQMVRYPWHVGGHTERAWDLVMDQIRWHRDPLVRMVLDYRPLDTKINP